MTLLIRRGLRPLEDMAKEADAIAAGDLTRRVQPTDGDGEIARLGRALNGMLAQIETAFAQRARSEDRLRSFLADASHELRTPLTSIRGYAELLRKDALGDEPARDRALSRIEKEAARMGSLVGDLAVLAREGEGPEPARHRVDLAAVAADAVADARTIDATRPIELSAPTEVPVSGDDARLEQMVHNLLGQRPGPHAQGDPGGGRGGGARATEAVLRGPGPGAGDDRRAGPARVRPLLPGRRRPPRRRVRARPVHRGHPGPAPSGAAPAWTPRWDGAPRSRSRSTPGRLTLVARRERWSDGRAGSHGSASRAAVCRRRNRVNGSHRAPPTGAEGRPSQQRGNPQGGGSPRDAGVH